MYICTVYQRIYLYDFIQLILISLHTPSIPSCMNSNNSNNYHCVNCQLDFEIEEEYMAHYKSEHHRYNIKRRLIQLPPLSLRDYRLQYQDDKTSKQSSMHELYCGICGKKFMSLGTYKQHLKSRRHKNNRQRLKVPGKLSRSSSSSDFEIIGGQRALPCVFCREPLSPQHMKTQHNFPPFAHECVDEKGLLEHVHQKINEGFCLYCDANFGCEDSVRRHMSQLGHSKLDIDNFGEYEKYYIWTIEESSSSSESEQLALNSLPSLSSSKFESLTNPTLADLEIKRLNRIKHTETGVLINGREVGYREYRNYYKQYLGRQIKNLRERFEPAIEQDKNSWKQMQMKAVCKPPKISQVVNFR